MTADAENFRAWPRLITSTPSAVRVMVAPAGYAMCTLPSVTVNTAPESISAPCGAELTVSTAESGIATPRVATVRDDDSAPGPVLEPTDPPPPHPASMLAASNTDTGAINGLITPFTLRIER